jgi:hypothetical protein
MSELHEWETFYVIVGSSAGALIGLQFVVMTLIAERPPLRVADAGAAFATPTIVHFCGVLLLSAVLSMPGPTITIHAIFWGLIGIGGMIYIALVALRIKRQSVYPPVFEDWLFHVVLPLLAYGALGLSSFAAHTHMREALVAVGAAALLLLFIGIHNAWDAVFYHVVGEPNSSNAKRRRDATPDKEKHRPTKQKF